MQRNLFRHLRHPPSDGYAPVTAAGRLYIDASEWDKWHYIDLPAVAGKAIEDPGYNPSADWLTLPVPRAGGETAEQLPASETPGIYTYWYDIFGQGLSNREFRSFEPAAPQPEPDEWTIAVHRNNVRTNGCMAAPTSFRSFDEIPEGHDWINTLVFSADEWNQTDVWINQNRMLSCLIGNQGIRINPVLSSWLRIDIPPMPPAFTLDSRVFILRLPDGSLGALRLENYQSDTGVKCCLTIDYRYPI